MDNQQERNMDCAKILDSMTLISTAPLTAVTLEMQKKDAAAFLFAVSKHLCDMGREINGPVTDVIGLGERFYWRGVWFRVVEAY